MRDVNPLESSLGNRTSTIELTLQRPLPPDMTKGMQSVCIVRGMTAQLDDEAIAATDPTYHPFGNETTEQLTLPTDVAKRTITVFDTINTGWDDRSFSWDGHWVFPYIAGERRSPNTPMRPDRHRKITDLEGPLDTPLEPRRLYAVSRNIGQTILLPFLTLDDPSRSLYVKDGDMRVADTDEVARSQGKMTYVTIAHIPQHRRLGQRFRRAIGR